MKRIILFMVFIAPMALINLNAENPLGSKSKNAGNDAVIVLNNESFKKMIFNYEASKVWKYEGSKPAIIDFYADWCAPCRQLSPVVEEIAKEYNGKIVIYKVNTDVEAILARNMGITGLPTLMFIPAKGDPRISMGVLPKETLVKAINEVLLVK
jgi:thioredoxin 1